MLRIVAQIVVGAAFVPCVWAVSLVDTMHMHDRVSAFLPACVAALAIHARIRAISLAGPHQLFFGSAFAQFVVRAPFILCVWALSFG